MCCECRAKMLCQKTEKPIVQKIVKCTKIVLKSTRGENVFSKYILKHWK